MPFSHCFPLGRPWESTYPMDVFVSLFFLKLIEPKSPVARYLTVGFMDHICTVWAEPSNPVDLFSSTEVNGATINVETLLWMCPLTLTTALKVWPSFIECKTRNEHFFRHQFISWLLKTWSGIWRGESVGSWRENVQRCPEDFFWQRFELLFTVIETPRSDFTSNVDQMERVQGVTLSSSRQGDFWFSKPKHAYFSFIVTYTL